MAWLFQSLKPFALDHTSEIFAPGEAVLEMLQNCDNDIILYSYWGLVLIYYFKLIESWLPKLNAVPCLGIDEHLTSL